MTADPCLSGSDLAPGAIACTRCHLARPAQTHPCPGCRCPEYSLSAADAQAEAERPRRKKKTTKD